MSASFASDGDRSKRRRPAELVAGPRGIEIRCPEHGHLLGILVAPGELEVKCRRDEYVVIKTEVPAGT